MLAYFARLKDVFFGKTDHRLVSHNRKFCKIVCPLFLEKTFHKESIILNNNNKTIGNNEILAEETFNNYFNSFVESLDIDKTLASNIVSSGITDLVFNTIKKYDYHSSIKNLNITGAVKI